jgi:hypothetical protein
VRDRTDPLRDEVREKFSKMDILFRVRISVQYEHALGYMYRMSLSLPFGHSLAWPQTPTLTRRPNLLILDNGGEVYRDSSANIYIAY